MTRELVHSNGAGEEETTEMIRLDRREGFGAYRRRNELLLELFVETRVVSGPRLLR